MQAVRYVDLVFQPDMLTAVRDDGTPLRLTRQERALLLRLCQTPHKLVTRPQLLQSMGELGGEFGERNIDYLVNRLRKRLGEHARAPRFIATQYGEGYIWIADPVTSGPMHSFLLMGPVYGLEDSPPLLVAVLERLRTQVAAALGGGRLVRCLPPWRFEARSTDQIAYSLETSLLEEQTQVHMALILRDGKTNTPIGDPFRVTLPTASDDTALQAFTQTLTQAIWTHTALPAQQAAQPTHPPLHLKLHDAGMLFGSNLSGWQENAPRLAAEHARRPDDPAITVMLAINRYAQLVAGSPLSDTQWQTLEDEIEQLALHALPRANGDSMLLFGIAKVLFFINRGYLAHAVRLTDDAFQTSTAFASAFAMKAQLQAAHGDIDAALGLYARAIELAEPGSQFHIYLLIMKLTALMADNRRGAIDHVTAELYARDPAIHAQVSLFFLSPRARQVPVALQPLLSLMTLADAQRLLKYLYRVSARQFRHKRHQRNVLRGAAVHLVAHFGPEVLPPEVRMRYPILAKPARQANRSCEG